MAEQEHTAGPYHSRGGIVFAANGDAIATCHGYLGVEQANATFFAAAPDQNKALSRALYWLEHPAVHDIFRHDSPLRRHLRRDIEAARAAIAKATPDPKPAGAAGK